jgi:hypothetical protein
MKKMVRRGREKSSKRRIKEAVRWLRLGVKGVANRVFRG